MDEQAVLKEHPGGRLLLLMSSYAITAHQFGANEWDNGFSQVMS